MCHKKSEKKNQNNEKIKIVIKNDNHSRIKPLKINRNPFDLIELHKISFLLIYFIIIIKIKDTASLRIRKLNKLNEIQIKIIGTGKQNILNSGFIHKPYEILVNGNPANIDSQNKINLENETNIITMKWNYKLSDCGYMFSGLTNLKEVDLSNFDGTEIKSMFLMFWNCNYLETVNFTNLKTPSLTHIHGLFLDCNSLLSADLSYLDTASVVNMEEMFSGCTSLTSINLNNFNTSKVKSMANLFHSCTALTSVDLSNFDTSSVKYMDSMFHECLSLTSLDLSKFSTDSLEIVSELFYDCKNLKYIDISNFNLSKAYSISHLFYGCENLEYINLNNFIEGNQISDADMLFNKVPNNIVYCINNKENIPLIMEELTNKICAINDCSDDWNSKQKLQIPEKDICVSDCSEDNKYIYQFKNKCYENCPNGTILSSDNKLCLIECTKDKPFKFQEECVSDCKGIDFFNNGCSINNKSIEAKETMIDKIKNDIVRKEMNLYLSEYLFDNKKDLIIYDDKEIYQLTSSFNQENNEYNEEPTINLGECENKLKQANNISDDKTLIIFKMEYFIDDFLIPITEYEIFNPETKGKLDLNVCNNTKIKIKIPVKIDNNNIYKYDPNSEYYRDKCFLNEDCENEDTLIQRKNEFNNYHLSLCEKNCKFIKYDNDTKNALCECEIKTEFTKLSKLLSNKNNLLFIIPELETDIYTNINESENSDNNIISSLITENTSSFTSEETTSQITDIYTYSNECLFIKRDTKECYDSVTLKDLFDKNYSSINTKDSIDKVFELFKLEFKNKNINKSNDEIIEGENVVFQMTTTEKQDYYLKNSLYINISSIDLRECEKILQKEYKINEPLIIVKADIKRNDTVSIQVEYELYSPINGQKLNMFYCTNSKIDIYPPINLDKETYDLVKHLKEQGYDLFDSFDDFYNDICSSYSSYNDTDVILNDRKNDFYIPNITLCEENCKYEEFFVQSLKAKCNCDIKTEVKSETSKVKFYPNKIIENFYKIESYANIKVVICYKNVFNLDKLKKNYGSYFMIVIGVLFIISMFLLFLKLDNKITENLHKLFFKYKHMIIQLNHLEKEKEKEKQKNNNLKQNGKKPSIDLKEKTRKNIKTLDVKLNLKNKKVNEINRSISKKKTKNYLIKKKKKLSRSRKSLNSINLSNSNGDLNQPNNIDGIFIFSNQFISSNYNYQAKNNKNKRNYDNENGNENKNDKFIKKIIYLIPKSKRHKYFSDEELNSLDYEYALKIDFRSYCQFYFCLLKETHLIIFTFFVSKDYNIFLLKFSLFLISFALFLFMNALFFNDDSMHKIYEDEGKYDFFYQIPQMIYSTIASQIISLLLQILSLSNDQIINLKEKMNEKEIKYELKRVRRYVKIKCVLFFFVGLILLFGFWYYLSAFCAVYYNTQIPLIKDNFISFFTSMIYPFLLDLLPGIFRIISLRYKIKCQYITSKIVTKIIGIL